MPRELNLYEGGEGNKASKLFSLMIFYNQLEQKVLNFPEN